MTPKQTLKTIAACKSADGLTEWEKSFIDSIAERADKYGEGLHVSDKQSAILEKIHEERVGKTKPAKAAKEESENPFPVSDPIPD